MIINEKFTKKIYCLLMTAFSVHTFVLNPLIPDTIIFKSNNPIQNYMYDLFYSVNSFDIIWITAGIFLYYFFYNNYFFENKINKEKIFIIIISAIIPLVFLIHKSYKIYNSMIMITYTPIQVFKTIMHIFGYGIILCTIFYKLKRIHLLKK
ncbi:MAG: hypothetical protein VZS44_01605 [Bacilli bacterium]|nr:hypothetical protein [Bacilli bacterium]